MTDENNHEEQIRHIDDDILAKAKMLVSTGLHDVESLYMLFKSINENKSLFSRYMRDGTVSTTCKDVMYYLDKLYQQAIRLETSTKIQDINNDNANEK